MSCTVMSWHVMLIYVSNSVMSCYVMSYYVTSCNVTSCNVTLCYAKSCYSMSCSVMSCYVAVCYVMLCHRVTPSTFSINVEFPINILSFLCICLLCILNPINIHDMSCLLIGHFIFIQSRIRICTNIPPIFAECYQHKKPVKLLYI